MARQVEVNRLAEEKANADLARQVEVNRLAEEKANADLARQVEANRLAEEKANADLARQVEANRLAEEKANADLARQVEANRLAEEADRIKQVEAECIKRVEAECIKRVEAERIKQVEANMKCPNNHSLTQIKFKPADFVSPKRVYCNICKEDSWTADDIFQRCRQCNFDVCVSCFKKAKTKLHAIYSMKCLNNHSLERIRYLKKRTGYNCNICKDKNWTTEDIFNRCEQCNFDICDHCIEKIHNKCWGRDMNCPKDHCLTQFKTPHAKYVCNICCINDTEYPLWGVSSVLGMPEVTFGAVGGAVCGVVGGVVGNALDRVINELPKNTIVHGCPECETDCTDFTVCLSCLEKNRSWWYTHTYTDGG